MKTSSPKLYIRTYGCAMNVHDSMQIAQIMYAKCNMELANDPKEADLILCNTCSVRAKAEEKLFSDLGRFKLIKRKKPDLIIGVGGCVAKQEKENIIKKAPYVDLVFGPHNIHQLPEMYEQVLKSHKPNVQTDFAAQTKFTNFPLPKINVPTALVTIMEGCNKYCSYCIVPFTRGPEVSRSFIDTLKECEYLASKGTKEIHLLGQNVNDYKGNLKQKLVTLADLIHHIAKINEIERIRFTTSYPTSLNDDLLKAFRDIPKLVNHLHLPVQSGSDNILKAMRRRYTIDEYKEKIFNLREIRPNISISSDFIVGFPGETEADFESTLNLINEIKFDHSYSFIYSPRPGTLAAKLTDNISLAEKKKRLKILQNQLNIFANKYSEEMIGTTELVLVDSHSKKYAKQLTGRTENNRVVNFIASSDLVGKIVPIKITDAMPNCLLGVLDES
jgi:tRNA-2-methylthio-N6-dimethylallyladenosine synthase